ncbi:hypothetical protein [Vibrio sp. LaRot3]|uniref:hypothetical protein n=1 Tax=Vibrio sp. LaRot3 TaxID=2998829 RepID=UPI0022CDDF2A|nr:hypothetical protein [Vibrio sp. LaRot3]MDA0148594.1 hypothetical protein [Vibrio sp. LaRot3]
MDIENVQKGMLIETKFGVGKVLVIDPQTDSLLIEQLESHHQLAVDMDDVINQEQLHFGCDKYY